MNNILLPVELEAVRDLADRSCKMTFATRELDNREFTDLRDLRGQLGWLMFGINELKEEEMPQTQAEVGVATPSMRLRNVLYVLYKQEKEQGATELVFDLWYAARMEGIIEAIKKKLK